MRGLRLYRGSLVMTHREKTLKLYHCTHVRCHNQQCMNIHRDCITLCNRVVDQMTMYDEGSQHHVEYWDSPKIDCPRCLHEILVLKAFKRIVGISKKSLAKKHALLSTPNAFK